MLAANSAQLCPGPTARRDAEDAERLSTLPSRVRAVRRFLGSVSVNYQTGVPARDGSLYRVSQTAPVRTVHTRSTEVCRTWQQCQEGENRTSTRLHNVTTQASLANARYDALISGEAAWRSWRSIAKHYITSIRTCGGAGPNRGDFAFQRPPWTEPSRRGRVWKALSLGSWRGRRHWVKDTGWRQRCHLLAHRVRLSLLLGQLDGRALGGGGGSYISHAIQNRILKILKDNIKQMITPMWTSHFCRSF